jgi:photosystem II stability/assembly factor-like uncharacterized protein
MGVKMYIKLLVFVFLLTFISIIKINSQTVTWVEQTSGLTTQLTSVSAVNPNHAWACGYAGRVLRTTNGGANWVSVNSSPIPGTLDLHTIFGIDSMTALVGGSGASSFLFRTTDGGATWSQVFTETGGFINSVQFGNSTAGFMMGDPVAGRWSLWGTTNQGDTWDSSSFYLPQVGAEAGWNNAFFFDVTAGVWFGTNNTRVYKSLTLVNWTTQVTTGQLNSYAIWFNNPIIGMTGGTALLITSNAGTTWQSTVTPLPGTANLSGITGSGSLWLVTRQATAIYSTTNLGLTWITSYTAPAGSYRHITKDREQSLVYFAVRNNGGISKGQITVGIEPISSFIPQNYKLHQNYPNPFNPVTNLRFRLPVEGYVTLSVFDAAGRIIDEPVKQNLKAGEYDISYDASKLTSGAYFYSLRVNDFVQTRKMILIK